MKKEGIGLFALIFIFLTKLTSAQFFSGYGYGSFSLQRFLDSLDPTTVTYGLFFFILFTVIFLILTKIKLFTGKRNQWGIEEPNKAAAATISFAISALIVYYTYRMGYGLDRFFYEIGFSGNVFSLLLWVLLLIVSIFIILKLKWPAFFIMLGLLFVLTPMLTDIIYEKNTSIIIGGILIVIGLFIWNSKVKHRKH